jgi:mRNA interferase MazF
MPFDPGGLGFGDIILVPFPFTDQSSSKKRPAVIISTARYNAERPDFIIMAITSQIRAQSGFGDALVVAWEAAGLLKPSAIKPVLATVEQSLTINQLGRLEDDDIASLRQVLGDIIDLGALREP